MLTPRVEIGSCRCPKLVLATNCENRRTPLRYGFPCRSLVDHGRRSGRVFTSEVCLRLARARDICSSSQIPGFRPSFRRLCIFCHRWGCLRTRPGVDVRWVYRRVGGQGKGDGCHDDARSHPWRDGWCRFVGVDGQRARLVSVDGALVLRGFVGDRYWRSHRPDAPGSPDNSVRRCLIYGDSQDGPISTPSWIGSWPPSGTCTKTRI
jgi:hypothetical protein